MEYCPNLGVDRDKNLAYGDLDRACGAILSLPVLGFSHRFKRAAIVSAIVLAECAVIALQRSVSVDKLGSTIHG